MILKTLCAFLALVLEIFGVYGDGEFKWYYGYVSLTSKYISTILSSIHKWSSSDVCFLLLYFLAFFFIASLSFFE